MHAGDPETGTPVIPSNSETVRVHTGPAPEDRAPTPTPLNDRFRPYTLFVQQWIPWLIIASVIIVFGSDFIFFNKVFLPMDFLQFWRPWDTLFPSKTPINNIVISDVAEGVYPLLHFVAENLKAGHFPLWNPYVFLGLPTAMIGVSNFVFNPLYVLLLWSFSTATAHSLAILVNLSVIASFSYLFFLERGLTRTAALFGSMVLAFNGHLMVWLEYGLADFAYAGTAVALYCFEKSLKEQRLRFIVLNGIVFGVLLLGGSIQWVFFLLPLTGLYAIARTVEGWNDSTSLWSRARPLRLYLTSLLLGVLIASPNLLFFIEYMGLSQRTIRTFAWVKEHTATFFPELFATFLFPNFFGYQPSGFYFARNSSSIVFQNYNELGVYMGVVTIPMAWLAIRAREFRGMAIFWFLVIVGALLVAMKPPLLYFLLYQYVPGFNGMQPTRTIILLPPAFAFLGALGVHALQSRPLNRQEAAVAWKTTASLVVVLIVLLVGASIVLRQLKLVIRNVPLAEHFRIGNFDFLGPLLILSVIAWGFLAYEKKQVGARGLCALFLALLLADLLPFGLRVNTRVDRSRVYPPSSGLQFLAQDHEMFRTLPLGFRYNTLMTADVAALGGYASMYPASYLALLSAIEAHELSGRKLAERNQNYVEPMAYLSPLLQVLNVKYLLTPPQAQPPADAMTHFTLKHRSDMGIFQAKQYLPRIFVVHEHTRVRNASEAIAVMLDPLFDPSRTAVVNDTMPALDVPPRTSDLGSEARLLGSRQSTDQFELDVHMSEQGILVVSEQYFPGWEARVDGHPSTIHQVDAVLMGVVIPKGDHHISLRFMPHTIRIGLIVSALTGALCITLLVSDRIRHRRRNPRTA